MWSEVNIFCDSGGKCECRHQFEECQDDVCKTVVFRCSMCGTILNRREFYWYGRGLKHGKESVQDWSIQWALGVIFSGFVAALVLIAWRLFQAAGANN